MKSETEEQEFSLKKVVLSSLVDAAATDLETAVGNSGRDNSRRAESEGRESLLKDANAAVPLSLFLSSDSLVLLVESEGKFRENDGPIDLSFSFVVSLVTREGTVTSRNVGVTIIGITGCVSEITGVTVVSLTSLGRMVFGVGIGMGRTIRSLFLGVNRLAVKFLIVCDRRTGSSQMILFFRLLESPSPLIISRMKTLFLLSCEVFNDVTPEDAEVTGKATELLIPIMMDAAI